MYYVAYDDDWGDKQWHFFNYKKNAIDFALSIVRRDEENWCDEWDCTHEQYVTDRFFHGKKAYDDMIEGIKKAEYWGDLLKIGKVLTEDELWEKFENP